MEGVEDAHAEGGEADEKEIGENDAIQGDGFIPTAGAVMRGGEGLNDRGREDYAEHGDDGQDKRKGPEEAVGEGPKFLGRGVLHVGGEDRNEGGGDDAVADEAAQKVGDAVSKNEGIGGEGGAEKEGDALVTDVAEDPADDGDQGNDGSGFEDLLLFGQRGAPQGPKPSKNNELTGKSCLT